MGIKIEEKPLIQSAFKILLKNLGPAKTAKLWQVFTLPKIDYLKIRKKLFSNKSIATISKEAKQFNKK